MRHWHITPIIAKQMEQDMEHVMVIFVEVVALDREPEYKPQNTTILIGTPKMVPLILGETPNIVLTMLRFQGCFAPQRPDSAGLLARLGRGPGGSWSQNGINIVIMIVVKKNINYNRSNNSNGVNNKPNSK